MIIPTHAGVTHDDSHLVEEITGGWEKNTLLKIKYLKIQPKLYTGFNQGKEKRYWYACVIVAHLRTYYTIFGLTDGFDALMADLCHHMETKTVWNPSAGGGVVAIGQEFTRYMNSRFPERHITMERVKYGSSAMGTALKKGIPIITAYFTGTPYAKAKSDGTITEEESKALGKGTYGHCVCITDIGLLWSSLTIQDNYEGMEGNQYKLYGFRWMRYKTWYPECFMLMIPD